MDGHAMIEAHLQQLCDARDRTAPGSPEEERACLAILDAMLSGATAGVRGKGNGALAQVTPDLPASFSRNCTSIPSSCANPLT
jgi:hypothetical protein